MRQTKPRNNSRSRKNTILATSLLLGMLVVTLNSFSASLMTVETNFFLMHSSSMKAEEYEGDYEVLNSGGNIECADGNAVKDVEECIFAGSSLGLSMSGESPFVKGKWTHTPRGCFSNAGQLHFSSNMNEVDTENEFWNSYALVCRTTNGNSADKKDIVPNEDITNNQGNVTNQVIVTSQDVVPDNESNSEEGSIQETNEDETTDKETVTNTDITNSDLGLNATSVQ